MDPETRLYPVLSKLKHNGKRYTESDVVEMTEAQAETLQALGVLGEPEDTSPAAADETIKLSAKEREAKIVEVISALDPDKDFNKDGSPKVKAVELLTGFDVSADEVKAVHAAMTAAQ